MGLRRSLPAWYFCKVHLQYKLHDGSWQFWGSEVWWVRYLVLNASGYNRIVLQMLVKNSLVSCECVFIFGKLPTFQYIPISKSLFLLKKIKKYSLNLAVSRQRCLFNEYLATFIFRKVLYLEICVFKLLLYS